MSEYIKKRKHSHAQKMGCTSVGAVLLSGMALSTSLAAGSALAAEPDEPTTAKPAAASTAVTLPEVSVIGSSGYLKEFVGGAKFTSPVSKTPKTMQIIDDQIMQDQGTTTLTEALRNTPGVGAFAMGETGSSNTGDAVYMRGVDSSGSIFVDGVRDAGNITHDTFNTEQVEVIKGADGSTFGRTALGGSINMVTKQADFGDDKSAELSLGTHDQKRLTLDANQQINDTTAVRLNLMGENSGVPGRDKVRNRSWGIAPAIAFGLGTDTRVNIDYLHIYQDNQPDGGVPGLGLPGSDGLQDPNNSNKLTQIPRPNSKNYYGTKSDFDRVDKDQLTVQVEKDINDSTLFHNTARWGRTHHKYLISSLWFDSDKMDSSWDINDLSNWKGDRVLNYNDQVNTLLTNQAGIVQDVDTGPLTHTLSYGLELSYESVKTQDADINGAPDINIYHPSYSGNYRPVKNGYGDRGHTETASAYLFDTVAIGQDWQFNGGLRLDRQRATYHMNQKGRHGVTRYNKSQWDSLVSWQLGGLYQINRYGNVYAQYAVAEEPIGTDGLILSSKGNYANSFGYDPQKSKTAELGTKWKLANDRLLLTAALFRTDIENQVEKDDVTNEYYQDGKKRVQGIELTAVGQLTDQLDISLGYTHMQTKVVKGADVAEDGSSQLNYTPKDAFTSWLTYTPSFNNKLSIGAGARYIGRMTRNAKNTHGVPDHINSYWVLDAMAKYAVTDNLDVQLNGYNLANKDYVAAINKKGHRYLPGPSRSAVLSLKMKF